MMRPGDKMDSYRLLAEALHLLLHRPWTLSVVGDGALRGEVEALFAPLGPGRVVWHGALDQAGVAELLSTAALYVWPGCGEAYGLPIWKRRRRACRSWRRRSPACRRWWSISGPGF